MRALICALLLLGTVEAGWFDDFSNQMNKKLNEATDWVNDVAAPAISEKANEVSETVQDPETHRSIKNWFVEKYDAAADFANNEVVPELKKAYNDVVETVQTSDDN